MATVRISDAVSAGIGFSTGILMTQYMFKAVSSRRMIEQVIVCLTCRGKNPAENKYCGHCGRALYPQPLIQCPKCGVNMPKMRFCGNCGSKLKDNQKKGISWERF